METDNMIDSIARRHAAGEAGLTTNVLSAVREECKACSALAGVHLEPLGMRKPPQSLLFELPVPGAQGAVTPWSSARHIVRR